MTEEIIIKRNAIKITIPEYCYDCPLKYTIDTGMSIHDYCRLDDHEVDIVSPRFTKCSLTDEEKEELNGRYLVEMISIE